ncbi:MAG: hypothetical protein RMJ19_06485 [Gemmatales bacterium]|nr:type-F conjugative transfer system protein TrbI [Gemmatales bacterium]MCS7160102.1 type-F conjugative transfer system protein TrbI [Gemmatales bacterium]MDW8175302.1 hypothetical protein [Gemmatales bacterium]MDW8221976.1 hypothetical protein [Gemmatales bacterium]
MRKLWLVLAVLGGFGWFAGAAVQAQQVTTAPQPEIVLIEYQTSEAKPAEAKPLAPTACAAPCVCRPTFCWPRFSLHSLLCRCPEPCPKPCPSAVTCAQPCPPGCPTHPLRPLFCREPAPCPRPTPVCEVKHAPCAPACPSACRPSLLDRLHSLLHRDCCHAPCHTIHAPAIAQPMPEKAPLPKPKD